MGIVLQIFLIIFSAAFMVSVVYHIRNNKVSVNYSLTWLAAVTVMLILSVFPQLTEQVGRLLGIEPLTDTAFVFGGLFLLIVVFTLTVSVSGIVRHIYDLAQNQALMEKRIRDLEESKSQNQQEIRK